MHTVDEFPSSILDRILHVFQHQLGKKEPRTSTRSDSLLSAFEPGHHSPLLEQSLDLIFLATNPPGLPPPSGPLSADGIDCSPLFVKVAVLESSVLGSPACLLFIHIGHLLFLRSGVGFPGGTSGKESACWCRRCRRNWLYSWVRKIPWNRKWQLAPVFLPGKFHGQRSLANYSPWGRKEWDRTKVT